ncbi:MAG: putative porin, partial [Planctomycetota bacterium]
YEQPVSEARLLQFEKELLEIRNQLSQHPQENGDLMPGWCTKDLCFEAEITVSYFGSYVDDRAYTGGADGILRRQPANDSTYVHQMLYALKFGFSKTFGNEWEAGFTIGSTVGNGNDGFILIGGPGNGNGQPYFGEDELGIYKAYIKYTPECVPGLTVVGGKFENPLTTTDLVWDAEITPEGLAQQYEFQTDGNFKPYVTMAQLIAREQGNDRDLHCFAWQVGFALERIADAVDWNVAFTFYDWDGFEDAPRLGLGAPGAANLWPLGTRTQTLFGNTISLRRSDGLVYYDVGDFSILNLLNKADFDLTVGETVIPTSMYLDLAWNADTANTAFNAFNGQPIGRRNDRFAWALGLTLGGLEKKGSMEFGYKYASIEPNAIVGAMGDQDFGYSNTRGHSAWLGYQVHDNISLVGTVWVTEPIYDLDHTQTVTPSFEFDVIFTY